jgi:predicted RNase H-like HicB family nuclease
MTTIVACGFSLAKEALDGCLEADISQGNEFPPCL